MIDALIFSHTRVVEGEDPPITITDGCATATTACGGLIHPLHATGSGFWEPIGDLRGKNIIRCDTMQSERERAAKLPYSLYSPFHFPFLFHFLFLWLPSQAIGSDGKRSVAIAYDRKPPLFPLTCFEKDLESTPFRFHSEALSYAISILDAADAA